MPYNACYFFYLPLLISLYIIYSYAYPIGVDIDDSPRQVTFSDELLFLFGEEILNNLFRSTMVIKRLYSIFSSTL